MEDVVNYVVANFKSDIKAVFSGSVPYLKLAGVVLGAWHLGRAALIAHQQNAAGQGDTNFNQAKIATARFADHILTSAFGRVALSLKVVRGDGIVGRSVLMGEFEVVTSTEVFLKARKRFGLFVGLI